MLLWTPENETEIREAFTIANNWRAAHHWPMRKLRHEIIGFMNKRDKLDGLTAARLKRMTSIRKKLIRYPSLNLNQIQDIAGCRIILPSISDVHTFNRRFFDHNPHTIRGIDPYIENPKSDGYRTHHIKLEFKSQTDDAAHHNGRRIELQVRTRLQHAWATAVEAVGLFRNEDMKAGQGDPDWLRLFELMSSEFAATEECSLVPNAPPERERRLEISDLDSKLNATRILDNIKNSVEYTSNYVHDYNARYYIIRYDRSKRIVSIDAVNNPQDSYKYTMLDELQNYQKTSDTEVVVVEVNKIANLKEAYPNYFGDVEVFMRNLRKVAQGKDAVEYTMPPQRSAPVKPKEQSDISWARRVSVQRPHYRR
jgi:ppGpp synthetase/RelA/SpoT-type nucleotidyltranferase